MYKEILKIPRERVAVLIGKKGSIKRNLERIFNVMIRVDSETGLASIESDDSLSIYEAAPAIKAIARGFNPRVAEALKDEDVVLEIINIEDYVGKAKNHVARMRSRLIGKEGKARKYIEELTHTRISVYGKTVAIIGKYYNVEVAKEGVEDLLKGAPHSNAFRHIINRRKDVQQNNP
ncbi:MAG: KH domain-containing protein [Candidatus Nanoarchaeia archaeon]|nr:KH domain-containing protein [Candidatus Nanoarchaeia archaeon]